MKTNSPPPLFLFLWVNSCETRPFVVRVIWVGFWAVLILAWTLKNFCHLWWELSRCILIKGLVTKMTPWGLNSTRCHKKEHWLEFRKKCHMISNMTRKGFFLGHGIFFFLTETLSSITSIENMSYPSLRAWISYRSLIFVREHCIPEGLVWVFLVKALRWESFESRWWGALSSDTCFFKALKSIDLHLWTGNWVHTCQIEPWHTVMKQFCTLQ